MPKTSVSIPIASVEKSLEMVRRAGGFDIIKVKVSEPGHLDTIREIRRRFPSLALRVDANGGLDRAPGVSFAEELGALGGIELFEQPCPKEDLEGLREIKEASDVPVFADESVQSIEDIAKVAEYVDGVNLKLAKCGGIRSLLGSIHTARALGLKVMIGCMVESSLGVSAVAVFGPAVDFADLDGHLLIDNDPFEGLGLNMGRIVLSHGPGLGVKGKKDIG